MSLFIKGYRRARLTANLLPISPVVEPIIDAEIASLVGEWYLFNVT